MDTDFVNEFKRKFKKDTIWDALADDLRIHIQINGDISSSTNPMIDDEQLNHSTDLYRSLSRAKCEVLCVDLFKQTITSVLHVLHDPKFDKGRSTRLSLLAR